MVMMMMMMMTILMINNDKNRCGITVFGTSAKWIAVQVLHPHPHHHPGHRCHHYHRHCHHHHHCHRYHHYYRHHHNNDCNDADNQEERGLKPRSSHNLSSLHTILSTGDWCHHYHHHGHYHDNHDEHHHPHDHHDYDDRQHKISNVRTCWRPSREIITKTR